MTRRSRLLATAAAVALNLLAFAAVAPANAQSNDIGALSRQVVALIGQGRYAEAIPIAQRALALAERRYGPNHPEVGASLNNLAELYRHTGRFAEAEPLYKRDLAISEKALGPSHPDIAVSLSNLALLYGEMSRYADAEVLLERALAIREKALGPDDPKVANTLTNLGAVHDSQGRPAEAERLYRRALAIREKALGPDDPEVGELLNNLAALLGAQWRFAEAEPLYLRAAPIMEKELGPDHPDLAAVLGNLGLLYKRQGRYAEAETLYRRDLTITQKTLGPDHATVGSPLNNIALLYYEQGRYAEAEALYRQALAIRERALGPKHPTVAATMNDLAGLYYAESRYQEAEALIKRAAEIREQVLGPDHPQVANSLNNLAGLYNTLGRREEAEPLFRRALAIIQKVGSGPNNPNVAVSLNNLALLVAALGRTDEAETLAKRAFDIRQAAYGPEHPEVANSLKTLAGLAKDRGRHDEATVLYRRTVAMVEKLFGPEHPELASVLNNFASLHAERQDWAEAARLWERSTDLVLRRARRGIESADGAGQAGKPRDEIEQNGFQFTSLIRVSHRLALADASKLPALARSTFVMAQWAQNSAAAASLAQMSARQASGDGALARLVRERQDLTGEWQARDKLMVAALSRPDATSGAVEEQRARLKAIDARLAAIDATLKREFPDYASLADPEPLGVEAAQAQLRDDEALVMFLDAPERKPMAEESFAWVVTRTALRFVRIGLGGKALADEVAALRCGLDFEGAWIGSRCRRLTGVIYTGGDHATGKPLPFDAARAHALHRTLFGQTEDLIAGKQLLIVPSGPLTQLPFHVLVTEKPEAAGPEALRGAAWMAKRHAITMLPSVPSLTALRQYAKTSRATKAFVGFGNPLLDGPDARYNSLAQLARDKQECTAPPVRTAAFAGARAGVAPPSSAALADAGVIRTQAPLPETADELCVVARDLGAEQADVHLGGRATEKAVKGLSGSGALSAYRIVHFATHGALAGQISGNAEPGLLLTPPAKASAADDGYLTASEIAGLRLDADWVILSACNTAAGGAQDAEAFSGLARAFFYAGARSLLVSHWAVDSEATVKLITKALGLMAADQSVGRAEALRRAMLAMIEAGDAHPSLWAPFVVVGEGAT